MLTAGVCGASQTDRSSVLGTDANLSIGRPLARRKSSWMAAATVKESDPNNGRLPGQKIATGTGTG